MAARDLLPYALRPAKRIGGEDTSPVRVSGVSDEALTPVPEPVSGPVFDYRGQEQHGVPVENGSVEPEDPRRAFVHTVDVEELGTHKPHPLAVRVVQNDDEEVRDWRVMPTSVGTAPVQIAGRHDRRTRLRISVPTSGHGIYISHDQSPTTYTGFPIAGGTCFELITTQAVYAICDDGVTTVPVVVVSEFRR
jgi:hypothetical protein